MKRRSMRTSGDRLWRIVIGRWGVPRGLVRPRLPLVLVRRRLRQADGHPRQPARPADYRIALHLQMSWPVWLVEKHVGHWQFERAITRFAASATAPALTTAAGSGAIVPEDGAMSRCQCDRWQRPVPPARLRRLVVERRPSRPTIEWETVRKTVRSSSSPKPPCQTAPPASHRTACRFPSRRRLVPVVHPAPAGSIATAPARGEMPGQIHHSMPNDGATTVVGSPRLREIVRAEAERVTHRLAARASFGPPAPRTLLRQPSEAGQPTIVVKGRSASARRACQTGRGFSGRSTSPV